MRVPGEWYVEDAVTSDLPVPGGVGRGAPLDMEASGGQGKALHALGSILRGCTEDNMK